MSWVLVATGQCGNQVGYSLLESVFQHVKPIETDSGHQRTLAPKGKGILGCEQDFLRSIERNMFFREADSSCLKYFARAVCVDTEQKAIRSCVERTLSKKESSVKRGTFASWEYSPSSIAHVYGGAGNNWALGYEMCTGEFLEVALDSIRREAEQCDMPPSLLVTHSVGGGTGSGMGTRLSENIADHFSDMTRVNIAIAPYHFGEVAVQHYNSLLCMSKVVECADAVILIENEAVRRICTVQQKIATPTIWDVNATIAGHLVPALLGKELQGQVSCANDSIFSPVCSSSFRDDVIHLCSSRRKFLTIYNAPVTSRESVVFTFDAWNAIMADIARQMNSTRAEIFGSTMMLRGMSAREAVAAAQSQLSLSSSSLSCAFSPHFANGYQRSACVVANDSSRMPILHRTMTKAQSMFEVSAYVHQYTAYGVEREDFVEAFLRIGQVIRAYTT